MLKERKKDIWIDNINNNIASLFIVRIDRRMSKIPGGWSNGLIASMDDPELLVISNESVVVIKDKFPKAQHHFLVLPRESIHSIYKVFK